VLELIDKEEFLPMVPNTCIKANALERIKKSLQKSIVVLFLKGSVNNPFDGYQRKAIEILREEKVRFTYFNVMDDPDVREILKEYSRFTAYP
jgi:monothiol glutaredoxin